MTLNNNGIGVNYLKSIGNTPLLHLARICPRGNLYAKAEWYNPGRSVKDRAAFHMVKSAIDSGELTAEKIILDATSGNTGIAYAMIGALLGYKVKLCIPGNVTASRIRILRVYGAELVFSDPLRGSDGAIETVRQLYADHPEHYYYPDQYSNENNWKAHFETTGPEIYKQTRSRVSHFVATLGTSGTFMGVGRFLKSINSRIRAIEVQPDSPFHGLEGLKHMETAIVPEFYDPCFADRKMVCRTEDAYQMVKVLALQEGILIGISGGAAVVAALQVAEEHPEEIVVTIIPDNGDKYLEERFWDD